MDDTGNHGGDQGKATGSNAITMQRPFIVALLYLLNIFLGFSVFVGLILAYIWRADAKTHAWEQTHYTYLIRTFWIGLVVMVAIFVAWLVLFFGIATTQAMESEPPPAGFFLALFGGMLLFVLCAVWFCVRCVLSMVKSGNQEPMPRPKTWLF